MKQFSGMRGFTIIWFGQLISLFGTGMTRFAITIWAYEQTGLATTLTLVGFFAFAPIVIFSPIAGALVDRWNRKLVVMFSDLGAGLGTALLLLLSLTGQLEIWHLFVLGALASSFEAFQFPAFSAATTLMLEKKDFARAHGMLGTANSASAIAAPAAAGFLLAFFDLNLLLIIDIVTALIAVGCVFITLIPQPEKSSDGMAAQGSLWAESIYGFRHIWNRPSLFGMQMIFLLENFFLGTGLILLPAYILARTGSNEVALGSVQSMLGVGGLIGGILMSTWGGPKDRVTGVLNAMILCGIFGYMLIGIGQALPIWMAGAFAAMFTIPIMNGSNQAIWQSKVAPDVQGRVFATRRLLAQITNPIAMLIAGPLADRIFEPAMQAGQPLAEMFGWMVGVGPGAGIGLIFVISGAIGAIIATGAYFVPIVRNIETILPDAMPTPSVE